MTEPFYKYMDEYREQMATGHVRAVYRGLMEYMMGLRTHFSNKYPEYFVSGSLYNGYMDMTYFAFLPQSLKSRRLKIAVVFLHDAIRFEAWLTGYNKQIQAAYWKLFKESGWNRYRMPATIKGVDSIVECVLADNPDFSDLARLTAQIEQGTLDFIRDIEGFLAEH